MQEILHYQIAGFAAIGEEELFMVESSADESARIVQLQIQSNDRADIILSKIVEIGFGRMARIPIVDFGTIVWPAKGNKFVWQNPIQIAIFHSFVILVFDRIEIVEIEEATIACLVHRLQAVHQADGVVRRTV